VSLLGYIPTDEVIKEGNPWTPELEQAKQEAWKRARNHQATHDAALIVAAVNELGGLLDALDAAERELEQAVDAHDREWREKARTNNDVVRLRDRLATLERENARLRKALDPFAECQRPWLGGGMIVLRPGEATCEDMDRKPCRGCVAKSALATQEPSDGE